MNIIQAAGAQLPLNEPTYLRVKRAIIADLMAGQFSPGTHLTIETLTSRYKISHMPIREALRQLEGEGILISIAHRGFRIEAITETYIRNIFDIRNGIESMLARRAVEIADERTVAEIRSMHEELTVLIRSGSPTVATNENVVFHRRICAIAQNPEAELILEGRTRVVRTVGDSFSRGYSPDIVEDIVAEHEAIVVAFERHDPAAAAQAVFEHVMSARDRMIANLAAHEAAGSETRSDASAAAR